MHRPQVFLKQYSGGPKIQNLKAVQLLNKQQQHLTMKEVATIHAQTKKMIPHVVSNAIRTFFNGLVFFSIVQFQMDEC